MIGVHQKLRAVLVDGYREVIRHALVKVEPRGPSKRSREVRSFLMVRGFEAAMDDVERALCIVRCPKQNQLTIPPQGWPVTLR
ncbi:MAG: hypothetical protein CM15mP25_4440 [Gammaproteobacteria bacterium]|nr:MAG: hypothetical protein CM15mP25_4440 [Gammaproteobacteria bacterium]